MKGIKYINQSEITVNLDVKKSDGSIIGRKIVEVVGTPIIVEKEYGNVYWAVKRILTKSKSNSEKYISLDVKIDSPGFEEGIKRKCLDFWLYQNNREVS